MISIVIPMYNTKKYIINCLNSFYFQKFDPKKYEVIVINDGSNDGSDKIVENYIKDKSNYYLFTEQNMGLGHARNYGMKFVKGEYVWFVDSDDYVNKNSLSFLYSKVKKNKDDILVFDATSVNEKGRKIRIQHLTGHFQGKVNSQQKKSIITVPLVAWNKIYKSQFIRENRFKFAENTYYEDIPVVPLMLAKSKKINVIPVSLYNYVQRSDSISHKISSKVLNCIKVNDQLKNNFAQNNIYDKYYDELEYIAISTMIFQVLTNVNMINRKSILQKEIVVGLEKMYPEALENKYLNKETQMQLKVALKGQFRKYYIKYGIKNKIKSIVKKLV